MKSTLSISKYLLAAIFLLPSFSIFSQLKADYNVIPRPQSIETKEGTPFVLSAKTKICYCTGDAQMSKNALLMSDYIAQSTTYKLKVKSGKCTSKGAIILKSTLKNENKEAYQITVCSDSIVINGASPAGVFYGIQTIRKSIPVIASKQKIAFSPAQLTDYPRFGHRGMMLDVARHFQPIEFVKRYIDLLALHNLNTFHWHLTDDQGWRIEIKSFPLLAQKASQRNETLVGDLNILPWKFDGKPYGPFFYTQEQIKEVVQYAAERYITVIPEIDMPGHMLAALSVYPNLGCTGGPYAVGTRWGVLEDVLCAGNEEVYRFVEKVLDEVVELFPGKYIHIGGDECPKVRWKECPKCQALIAQKNLAINDGHTPEAHLQSYFTQYLEEYLKGKNRKLIGWDEILEGGIKGDVTIMSWRGTAGGTAAAINGLDAIMAPHTHLYFDYYQTDKIANEPMAIGGNTPLEKVYGYEPVPAQLTPSQAKHIKGVQANLWTEYITTAKGVEYMVLPRMAALSEVAWSNAADKNWENFLTRITSFQTIYERDGYNYRKITK